MNNKRRGTAAEHRTMRVLEAAGYACSRSAASLGLWDIIAVGPKDIRLIQVKFGIRPALSGIERKALELFQVPPNVSKELWKWRVRARTPDIEVL